jgi:hypothetical protein
MATTMSVARRGFLQLCSSLAGWGVAQLTPKAQAAPPPARGGSKVNRRKPYIAIQVPPFCFVDEGTEKVLDILQEKAHVNTVWAYTYSYEHHRLTKDGPIPLPGHGIYEFETYHGGAFHDYDPKFFQNTILNEFRSPDYKKIDIIREVLPKAKARGIDFIAWDYNNAFPNMPREMKNAQQVLEIDVYGRRGIGACFNNRDFRNHLFDKIEDYLKTYPELYGIAWGCERMGPLMNMIGAGWTIPFITCFCPDCQSKGRARGISVERARRGYVELDKLFHAARADKRPLDGYFVTFWRMLLEYPEILAWEKLWTDSYHDVRAELYGIAKAIAPEKPFGFHVMHNMTLSPFYRAEEDYTKTSEYADFIKPAIYNNSGGPRMAEFLNQLHATMFHDGKPEDFLPMYYKIMNIEEAPFAKLSTAGLSSDYVFRETKRAVAGVGPDVAVYPGLDIDIPTNPGEKHTTPEDVRQAVKAAISGGAEGVVLSRRYAEMRLENLAAAGQGLKEAGVV